MNNRVVISVLRTFTLPATWVCLSLLWASLSGCVTTHGPAYELAKRDKQDFAKPIRAPKTLTESNDNVLIDGKEPMSVKDELVVTPPRMSTRAAQQAAEEMVLPKLGKTKVTQQSYNDLPIPVFINEVFGNQLQLNFVLQPSLRQAPDLVSLRISEAITQADFYVLATRTLADYGITTAERDGVLVFDYAPDAAKDAVPLLASGKTLPEVPEGNRTVFFIYLLESLTTPNVRGLLAQMFPKNDPDIQEDITRNALLLKGKPKRVKEVVEAIRVLDQAPMAGMYSTILKPVISTPEELSDNLLKILETEGYSVRAGNSTYPVRLLPLPTAGQVIVFAKSKEILNYVIKWAQQLEKRNEDEVEQGLFSYQVQSTKAGHIVDLLGQLGLAQGMVGASETSGGASSQNQAGANNVAPRRTANLSGAATTGARFAVDEQLNTILFSGTGKEWKRTLDMIKRLDKPAPSVLVEVILAEVSLEESEESAIEWLFNSSLDRFGVVGSTIGALGQSGGGLSLNLSNAGQTRAALNLLYNNSRSTIRSRPRLMVKSGAEASIDVGDRVPIITSNVQSTVTDNPQLIQNVSYQETGVLLDIKPTVHASGFVDIEISQELSEAVNTDSSSINSPTIRTRSIQTTLTLRDGGSVLIGGLIRSNEGDGEVGVPILGKLPGIGKLFRGDSMEQRRTELMIMIIPYILNSPDEVESLSDDLQKARLQLIQRYE